MIKGIDSQIITGRTTDFMKDNSARLKGDEFNQLLHSKQNSNDVRKELKTVTDVKKGEIRKTDDKDDGKKKNKKQDSGKNKDDKKEIIIETRKVNNDSNAVSGNETVGYSKLSNIDIEI